VPTTLFDRIRASWPGPSQVQGAVPESWHLLLPSNLDGLRFRAQMRLSLPPAAAGARTVLYDRLVQAAQGVTSKYSVLHLPEAQDHLNAQLSRELPYQDVGGHGPAVWAGLAVDQADLELAQQQVKLRHAETLAREQYRSQAAGWDHLRSEVLSDPARTRLWWLNGRSEKLAEMVNSSHVFDQVIGQLAPMGVAPVAPTSPVADVLERFLRGLGPEHHELLLEQLATVFRNYERPELADEVRALDAVGLSR
jgi:hypothetical protein